jgi:hypothetical protein
MPIDYKKYPKDWKQIRQRILERADNKCECCGLKNKTIVSSFKNHQNIVVGIFKIIFSKIIFTLKKCISIIFLT